ncbi:MAG: SEC-C metal-binding domain-containing protein [Syntrophobacteraceae bacterium]
MEDNPSASGKGVFNPLQPVYELIQGADPGLVCIKYGISRTQLDKMTSAYQASRREAAVAGCFTASKTNRNDPCPCGSGKKYKKCCLPGHEEARRLMPKEQLKQMEERAKAREKVEKEVRKGFELIFSLEYERADQYARKQIETFPEDDRFYDILLSACFALGDYDAAFQIARKRWQTAVEEKLFFQENGYHKREGVDRDRHVHFYSPSTWLEKFWIAQRARTWREQYGVAPLPSCALAKSPRAENSASPPRAEKSDSPLAKIVEKLQAANDLKRFPAKQEEGFEARKLAFAPVIDTLQAEGPAAIPFLLPTTYNFTWASLFVPGLLHAWGTQECIRILAELSMFRYPYFSQKCLAFLEQTGERAVPVISLVMEENPAFDELKAGLLNVLGNVACRESFEILAKFTEHENRYIVAWACEALGRHKDSEALPFLERAKQRMGPLSQIAGAIKEIAEFTR